MVMNLTSQFDVGPQTDIVPHSILCRALNCLVKFILASKSNNLELP